MLAFPCVVLLFYRRINIIDKFDFSLSVSNDQAQDLLLSPEITQLEDWEISLSAQPSNLNLEAVRDGSQVFICIFS